MDTLALPFLEAVDNASVLDLAHLSITCGLIECHCVLSADRNADSSAPGAAGPLDAAALLASARQLAGVFHAHVRANVQLPDGFGVCTRANIQAVTKYVWSRINTSYKADILHAQTLLGVASQMAAAADNIDCDSKPKSASSSALPAKPHLDCFGISISVLAACQVCDMWSPADAMPRIRLALSEDHAFLAFTPDGSNIGCTAEVTLSDKLRMATEVGAAYEPGKIPRLYHSWLYLMDCGGGPDPISGAMPAASERHFVRCNPRSLVAALIHSLNPTFGTQAPTASQRMPKAKPMPFSRELSSFQGHTLYALWRRGALDGYPMGLSALSIHLPWPARLQPLRQAIHECRTMYADAHPTPYFDLAQYFGMRRNVRFAIACCARGARVLCRYNKSSLDETMMQDIRLLMCELSNLVAGDFHDPTSYKHLAPRIATDSATISGGVVSNFTPVSAPIAPACPASDVSSSSSSSSSAAASSSPSASEPWLHPSHADDSRAFGDGDLTVALDSFDVYVQLLDLLDAVATWEQNGADPAFNGGAPQKASAPLITEQCAKDMVDSVARFSAAVRAQAASAFDVNANTLGSLRITSVKMANAITQFAALDHIPFAPRLPATLQLDQQPAAAAQQLSKAGKVALTNVLNSLTAACAAPAALGKRKRTASAAAAP